jgi:homoserine dehydrogenase
MKEQICLGLVGFGTVGTGVVKLLTQNKKLLEEKLGAKLLLKRVVDKDILRRREVELDKGILSRDINTVLRDKEIDIVIELIGGLEPARRIILEAIAQGKSVVTANKALLASAGEEIFAQAEKYSVSIGFEACVAAGVPVIRSISETLSSDKIEYLYGIINGTSNYILSKMSEGKSFKEALSETQTKGYAERNPTLDIEGYDTAHKLIILTRVAFGSWVPLNQLYVEGIKKITARDIEYAREWDYVIKLLAIGKKRGNKLDLRVHPTLLRREFLLSSIQGVLNGILIKGEAVDKITFSGQGAGQMPTATAVVSDVLAIGECLKRRSRSLSLKKAHHLTGIIPISELVTRYYIRFNALDKPGVLAQIGRILGDHNVSIASVIQKERSQRRSVPVVMMTHRAKEVNVQRAVSEIDKLPVIKGKSVIIRVEEIEE